MGKIPDKLRKIIAENIRNCRLKKFPGRGGGKKCAEQFGVSPQQWSPWERGGRTPDEMRLEQIAAFFDVTVEFLRRDNSALKTDVKHTDKLTPPFPFPPGAPTPLSQTGILTSQPHLVGLDYFALFRWFYTSVFKDGLTDRDISELSREAFNRFLARNMERNNRSSEQERRQE